MYHLYTFCAKTNDWIYVKSVVGLEAARMAEKEGYTIIGW